MTTHDALLQLFGVGVVWMSVHCAGMCGPLLTGLDVSGAARGASLFASVRRMLSYQAGRAITYASLGAIAGALGGALAQVSTTAGAALAVLLGAVALARAVRPTYVRSDAALVQIGKRARAVVASTSPWRPALLGVTLGFLPCMIAVWALGLAALTASPFGGALVMLGLVVLTTPIVVVIGALGRSLGVLAGRAWLQRALLALSGLWLLLVGLAGAGAIDHAHLHLLRGYVIMLF